MKKFINLKLLKGQIKRIIFVIKSKLLDILQLISKRKVMKLLNQDSIATISSTTKC